MSQAIEAINDWPIVSEVSKSSQLRRLETLQWRALKVRLIEMEVHWRIVVSGTGMCYQSISSGRSQLARTL